MLPVTANRIVRGSGAPSAGLCANAAAVGKVYIRSDAAATFSTFYVCANTAAMTYAWELGGGGGGGGGGDTITSPNGTIMVGGTSTNSTVDVDSTVVPLLANNNVYAGLNNQNQQIVTKTTTYTTTTADRTIVCDTATAGAGFTVSLVATPTTGLVQGFKNTGAFTCTLSGNGKNIDGSATSTLLAAAGDYLEVQYDGTQWRILPRPSGTIATGTKALATSAISSASCTSAQTATATGTLTTDIVTASFNGDPTAVTGYVPLTSGMLTIIVYPTADTVNFKVCNNTSSSITPGAITLNYKVSR